MGDYEDSCSVARELREKAKKIEKEQKRKQELLKEEKRRIDTQIYQAEMRRERIRKILPYLVVPLLTILSICLSQCEDGSEKADGYYISYSHQTIIEKRTNEGNFGGSE